MGLRLDRLTSLYIASPLMRFVPKRQLSIPILMYHSIAEKDESRVRAYFRTATSPAAFAAQMEYLSRNGYRTCSVAQVVERLNASSEDASKSVAITFDDGYADFYRNAFPVLNQFNFTATMYLPTACIGESPLRFKEWDCLTWSQVRELQGYGISFGSHTVTHPQLRNLGESAIERELVDSRSVIEERTGCGVDSFAYPYAFPKTDDKFKKRLREALVRAGYRNGVCTIVGRANRGSDPLFLQRLPINSLDDTALFQAKLAGAYDWVALPQSLIKQAKIASTGKE